MTDPDFPHELSAFIQDSIPNVDAAELLLLLARHPDRYWEIAAMIDEIRPTVMTETAAARYLAQFVARGLVAQKESRYQYSPTTPELDAMVHVLTKAYNERPVTLVRMIYSLKDEKIRSFADAFRLKKP